MSPLINMECALLQVQQLGMCWSTVTALSLVPWSLTEKTASHVEICAG